MLNRSSVVTRSGKAAGEIGRRKQSRGQIQVVLSIPRRLHDGPDAHCHEHHQEDAQEQRRWAAAGDRPGVLPGVMAMPRSVSAAWPSMRTARHGATRMPSPVSR